MRRSWSRTAHQSFELENTKPGSVTELLAALTVRYRTVPIDFAPRDARWRKSGRYRSLGAALAYHQAELAPPRRT